MAYKTELHCHVSGVSACAYAMPATVAEKYQAAGYTTLVLTDHFSDKTFDPHPELATWEQKVNFFWRGGESIAEAAGSGLIVIQAAEIRMKDDPNDYLVYGITKKFMLEHENLLSLDLAALSTLCRKEGFLLVQAHPFRNGMNIVRPDLLDGMEVFNAHTGHVSRNDIAFQWASRYALVMTSGSDYHDPDNVIGGGITTAFPITDADMLVRVLRSRCYDLIREGCTF